MLQHLDYIITVIFLNEFHPPSFEAKGDARSMSPPGWAGDSDVEEAFAAELVEILIKEKRGVGRDRMSIGY